MIIQPFASGTFGTNAYVIACPQTKSAAIIDPSENSTPLLADYIEKHHLKPEKILLTHSHWDHIVDVPKVKALYNIPVYIHEEDVGNLMKPGSDGLPIWIDFDGVKPDGYLNDDDVITVGNLEFKVIHTPGHSPGGICLYCEKEGVLISGDTLFKGSIGNLSFPTAQTNRMWHSLAKLAKLPAETRVYPGHGNSTTIGRESWLPNAQQLFGE